MLPIRQIKIKTELIEPRNQDGYLLWVQGGYMIPSLDLTALRSDEQRKDHITKIAKDLVGAIEKDLGRIIDFELEKINKRIRRSEGGDEL